MAYDCAKLKKDGTAKDNAQYIGEQIKALVMLRAHAFVDRKGHKELFFLRNYLHSVGYQPFLQGRQFLWLSLCQPGHEAASEKGPTGEKIVSFYNRPFFRRGVNNYNKTHPPPTHPTPPPPPPPLDVYLFLILSSRKNWTLEWDDSGNLLTLQARITYAADDILIIIIIVQRK